jgi:branched-chain amino acid transport system permease protein
MPDRMRFAGKIGLIAGIVGIYLAMTGVLERFNERPIVTEVVSLGYFLLLATFLVAGNRASRASEDVPMGPGPTLLLGLVGGASAGVLMAVFLFFFESVWETPRRVFVSISPTLLETILELGRGLGTGLAFLIVGGGLLGALGAFVRLLTPPVRRLILVGIVAVLLFSLSQPLLDPMFGNLVDIVPLVIFDEDFWFTSGGLNITGAIVVFVIAVALSIARDRSKGKVKERVEAMPKAQRTTVRVVQIVLTLAVVAVLPQLSGSFVANTLVTVGIYVLLGIGLNIVVGYAGLLDLGYVAFFAIGAYAAAIFTSPDSFLVKEEGEPLAEAGFTNFWFALPIVIVITVVLGVAIGAPVLRLRGDYLAIVTLGFGEIIRTLVLSDWLSPWLGGAQGLTAVPAAPPARFELRDPENLYYLVVAFCLLCAFISYRLQDSRVGRAWIAMREDEQIAEATGISVIKYKLLAFAMGAGIGCLGGAFFAVQLSSVFPNSFTLLVSINVLAIVILGGMGSIPGVVVGAFVLVGLPELLREFAEYRLLLYGAILMVIMILKPEGLIPSRRRQLELHEEEILEEQFAHRTGVDTGAPVVATAPATPAGTREDR